MGSGNLFPALQAGTWMAVILVSVGLGLLAVGVVRRRLLNSREPDSGLALDDLRRQRDDGLLTAAEYDAIRKQVVARIVTRPGSTHGG